MRCVWVDRHAPLLAFRTRNFIFTYFSLRENASNWLQNKRRKRISDASDLSPAFSLARDQQTGPKIKLKTEIERNENSIELLTLIFRFFSSLVRLLTTGRYVCQELMMETEFEQRRKFFHMKSEWNVSGGKAFRVIGVTCAIGCRLESSDCTFFIYIFSSLWSHASFLWYLIVECLTRKRDDVCTIAHWSVRSGFIVNLCASTRHFCSVNCLTDFAAFLTFTCSHLIVFHHVFARNCVSRLRAD